MGPAMKVTEQHETVARRGTRTRSPSTTKILRAQLTTPPPERCLHPQPVVPYLHAGDDEEVQVGHLLTGVKLHRQELGHE